jgi:uncharacterized membrane protein
LLKEFISRLSRPASVSVLLAALGVVYPMLVYIGLRYLPPIAVVAALFVPLALKVFFDRRKSRRGAFAYVPLIALGGGAALIAVSPVMGLKSYPIFVSLGFASVFGYSLLHPPTIIERIARLRSADLPPWTIAYLRKVTIAWLGFFLFNASVSLWTATASSIEIWTLYNGFISYVLMGVLFAGELLVRWRLKSRHRTAS